MNSITSNQLLDFLESKKNILCIDVRNKNEFRAEHIGTFINIPLKHLSQHTIQEKSYDHIVVSCASGIRSKKAQEQLSKKFSNILNLEGGLNQWKHHQLPTVKGRVEGISVMRQVQIIIGIGVLTGVFGSLFIHSNFIWIAAFFGAGILFAGLSNTCALARLLGLMPWNK